MYTKSIGSQNLDPKWPKPQPKIDPSTQPNPTQTNPTQPNPWVNVTQAPLWLRVPPWSLRSQLHRSSYGGYNCRYDPDVTVGGGASNRREYVLTCTPGEMNFELVIVGSFMYLIIPWLLQIMCTTFIIYELWHVRKTRHLYALYRITRPAATPSEGSGNANSSVSSHVRVGLGSQNDKTGRPFMTQAELRAASLLIVVSLLAVVLTSPTCIITIYLNLTGIDETILHDVLVHVFEGTSQNHGTTIIVYCAIYRQFRLAVLNLLACRDRCQPRSSGQGWSCDLRTNGVPNSHMFECCRCRKETIIHVVRYHWWNRRKLTPIRRRA